MITHTGQKSYVFHVVGFLATSVSSWTVPPVSSQTPTHSPETAA
jgi:hypothetical protein